MHYNCNEILAKTLLEFHCRIPEFHILRSLQVDS